MKQGVSPAAACLALACLIGCTAVGAGDPAGGPDDADDDHPPSADALLAEVRARLPRAPLDIEGEWVMRRRRGVETGRYAFTMQVDWASLPGRCEYIIRDPLGAVVDAATVSLHEGRPRVIRRVALPSGELSADAASIGASDLGWQDLSLAFLWWRGGQVLGVATLRNRPCWLLDIPSPDGGASAAAYSRVRLWLDQEALMMLQVEAYRGESLVRRLWVRRFQKTDEGWMITELDVESPPAVQRTRVRIDSVSSAATP